ncbi:MAG: GGDEF domain-containing protein, partial [Dokdonella sp.]
CSPVSSRVTVSIGVCAMQPDDAVDATVLVDTADRALYAAKQAGRNRVVSRRVRRAVRGIGQKDS